MVSEGGPAHRRSSVALSPDQLPLISWAFLSLVLAYWLH
jgi:hypothetical protein